MHYILTNLRVYIICLNYLTSSRYLSFDEFSIVKHAWLIDHSLWSNFILKEKHVSDAIFYFIDSFAIRTLHLAFNNLSANKKQVKVLQEFFIMCHFLGDSLRKWNAPVRNWGNCGSKSIPIELLQQALHEINWILLCILWLKIWESFDSEPQGEVILSASLFIAH